MDAKLDIDALVNDPDPLTRGMVAAALGAIRDSSSVAPLVTLLTATDRTVRIAAARSLGELGSIARSAFEPLLTLLEDEDDELRITVLAALAQLQDPRAFAPVVVRLFDANDEVRRNAAAAIGCLGNRDALQPLLVCLKDDYHWVRANAAWSLGQLRLGEALPDLEKLEREDPDEDVRSTALTAIVFLDADRGIARAFEEADGGAQRLQTAALVIIGEQAERLSAQQQAQTRTIIRRALDQEHGDDTAVNDLRSTAVWTLGRLPYEALDAQRLMALVDDSYYWTATYAIEALGIVHATEARPLLERVVAGKVRLADPPREAEIKGAVQASATETRVSGTQDAASPDEAPDTDEDGALTAGNPYEEVAKQALALLST